MHNFALSWNLNNNKKYSIIQTFWCTRQRSYLHFKIYRHFYIFTVFRNTLYYFLNRKKNQPTSRSTGRRPFFRWLTYLRDNGDIKFPEIYTSVFSNCMVYLLWQYFLSVQFFFHVHSIMYPYSPGLISRYGTCERNDFFKPKLCLTLIFRKRII